MKLLITLWTLVLLGGEASAQGGLQRSDVGDSSWNDAIARASSLLADATPEELNNLTYGFTEPNGCSGNSGSMPRAGFPGMCLSDGPAGVRSVELVTGFASGVSVAASWNRQLAGERGYWMGREFRAKGVQAALGPSLGPIGRTVLGGRAWEAFGADPYLNSQLGVETVVNLQRSVISVVKHYLLNEQETQRLSVSGLSVSSDADDQTIHELYLTPFQDAIKAGAAAVMCAYNRVNGTYACENDRLLNQLLKGELNFPGFVVSDWVFGQKSGLPSANNGMDLAMPLTNYWANGTLANAVTAGNFSINRLKDMAQRILSSWFLVTGPDSDSLPPGSGLPADLVSAHKLTDAREPGSRFSTKQSAIEGHVLVKNVNGTLPLKSPRLMSIFGWDATIPLVKNVFPAGGLTLTTQNFGLQSVNISDADLFAVFTGGLPSREYPIADQGTLLNGGGSGSATSSYWIDPISALTYQARQDQTFLYWDLRSIEPMVAQSSDVCLVLINQGSSEALDRSSLTDSPSDTLVKSVASQCSNTVVVIHNTWIRLVDDWIDHPNVTAVMFAHLPGQESGEALVDVLYGKTSPSGRLPYTVAKSESDYGDLLRPATGNSSDGAPHSVFSEGINIDYRYFLSNDIEPRYPFGYGLTYSSFEYSDITAKWTQQNRSESPPDPLIIVPGGVKSLWDNIAKVSVTVQNTGDVPAAEVSQLYVQFPGDDKVRHLRGFSKDTITPGNGVTNTFKLTRRDLSRWDTTSQSWKLQTGEYRFYAGSNVNDVKLQASLTN